jgi:aspartate/methionine/tyrosine aminotransferase
LAYLLIIAGQYAVFTAFLEQGDEVIMFEPFFDQYLPSVTFNGGKPVYVPMHPPKDSIKNPKSSDWTIDIQELRYVFPCEGVSTYLNVFEDGRSLHAPR